MYHIVRAVKQSSMLHGEGWAAASDEPCADEARLACRRRTALRALRPSLSRQSLIQARISTCLSSPLPLSTAAAGSRRPCAQGGQRVARRSRAARSRRSAQRAVQRLVLLGHPRAAPCAPCAQRCRTSLNPNPNPTLAAPRQAALDRAAAEERDIAGLPEHPALRAQRETFASAAAAAVAAVDAEASAGAGGASPSASDGAAGPARSGSPGTPAARRGERIPHLTSVAERPSCEAQPEAAATLPSATSAPADPERAQASAASAHGEAGEPRGSGEPAAAPAEVGHPGAEGERAHGPARSPSPHVATESGGPSTGTAGGPSEGFRNTQTGPGRNGASGAHAPDQAPHAAAPVGTGPTASSAAAAPAVALFPVSADASMLARGRDASAHVDSGPSCGPARATMPLGAGADLPAQHAACGR